MAERPWKFESSRPHQTDSCADLLRLRAPCALRACHRQLFTESTLSATIPIATHPTIANIGRLARKWGIVFAANMLGTFTIAFLISRGAIGYPEHLAALVSTSRHIMAHDATATLTGAIPAGFLLAAVAWSLPAGRGQEFWITLFFTYFIALGGFAHVVAGSGEARLLALTGTATFGFAIFGFILSALVGNVIGGTLIFALLAHAQVSSELSEPR